ncbi:hypothetical protein OG417_07020 [Actinoallomurus sp. NBC_01490]|jgi:hypothetical protein|uniref:hypothetical protein n=1 Tax=Actinoallomurus sp. NBC_01490 TaxID=2903557 RepID=UPI002E2FCD90|nr:hypothetical protein [Actinoallomurus sp. NBC_01490]
MTENLRALEFPDELWDVKERVGVSYPDEDVWFVDIAIQDWKNLQKQIQILSTHPAHAIAQVGKNKSDAVDSFLRFWTTRPLAHHADLATGAGLTAGAMLAAWRVVLAYQKFMIDNLRTLKKYLHDNEKYAWASFLPGVTDDGTRTKNAVNAVNKTKKLLVDERKNAIGKIAQYATDLDKAKKLFDGIEKDILKREGFHWKSDPTGEENWLEPPNLGSWVGAYPYE